MEGFVLFSYKVIKLVKKWFPKYALKDNFKGHTQPDLIFYNEKQNNLFIMEIKSEKECQGHPGYTDPSFRDFRKKVKDLKFLKGQGKYLIYFYQVFFYYLNRYNILDDSIIKAVLKNNENVMLCLALPSKHFIKLKKLFDDIKNKMKVRSKNDDPMFLECSGDYQLLDKSKKENFIYKSCSHSYVTMVFVDPEIFGNFVKKI